MTPSHIRRNPRVRPILALVLLCLFGSSVWAQTHKPVTVTNEATASTTDPRLPTSVRFIKAPSDETPAARARRLKRECKGKPNAGMCLGHAS